MFKTLLLVVLTTALINNVVLSQFLGICSFIGVSKNIKTAAGNLLWKILICSRIWSNIFAYLKGLYKNKNGGFTCCMVYSGF